MHWDNLGGLAPILPVTALVAVMALALHVRSHRAAKRRLREQHEEIERYWALEMAHQMKLRALAWIRAPRTRKLTFQPAMADTAIAHGLAGDYVVSRMADHDFSPRLARAKFRAWHRGTREADYTIGGFYDRHHSGWGEEELAWFEALLEEEDCDILGWAMAQNDPPEKYQGGLMSALQKLDYVAI